MRNPRPGLSTIPAIAQSPAASPTKAETRYLDERFKPTHRRIQKSREPDAEVNPRRALRDRCCACPSDRFPS